MTPRLFHRVVGAPAATAPCTWILHGLLGSGRNWAGVAASLAAVSPARYVLVDLRGHGRSPLLAPPHTLDACVDDLLALAHSTGLWPRHLLGHSLGGKVLLQLATRADAVQRLRAASGGGTLTLGVLDSTPGRLLQHGGGAAAAADADSVTRVLRLIESLPQPLPSRSGALDACARAGLPHRVGQWLASSLTRVDPPGAGFCWAFDPAGATALFASHGASDLWGVLLHGPPPGVELHLVMAERSTSRWGTPDAAAALQQMAARAAAAAAAAAAARDDDDARDTLLQQRGAVHVHTLPNAGHWLHVDNPAGLVELLAGRVLEPARGAPRPL